MESEEIIYISKMLAGFFGYGDMGLLHCPYTLSHIGLKLKV
jgi:hypothetical protein